MDAEELGVDYLTVAGHKFYGPRVGALFVRGLDSKATPLVPLMYGGGQEKGYRSGYVLLWGQGSRLQFLSCFPPALKIQD